MERPILKVQEIPFDSPESNNFFIPGPDKPFVATPAAIAMYSVGTILTCLTILQAEAQRNQGIDYLQVFEDPDKSDALWFIEDGPGGAITALLPGDY